MKPAIFAAIMDQFTIHANDPIISESESTTEKDSLAISTEDSEVVKAVKEILETRVRPVIQGDGGDLEFCGFDEPSGTVKLKLQGACRSCSSSVVTLKNGIENMLRFYVPEVKLVEQVHDEAELASDAAFHQFEDSKKPKE